MSFGSGYGLFAREYGLTCYHLDGLTMVSGRGEVIDSRDDPDLLWACCGGANGNFGVITSLRFRTQVAPPLLTAQRFNGAAYPTLQAIKRRYDPENVIRHAQSVVA